MGDMTYLETISKTPMVKLDRVLPAEVKANNVRVLCKMVSGGGRKDKIREGGDEGTRRVLIVPYPGNAKSRGFCEGQVEEEEEKEKEEEEKKDQLTMSYTFRIALAMIEKMEKEGKIKPGVNTIVEYTSGNTGIGLAMVCAAKGYKLIVCMPQMPSFLERYIICRQFGADVHLTNASKGMPGLKEHAEALLAANPSYVCTEQFTNEANPGIHFDTTAPEIFEQAGEKVDYFIGGVGTGGTINGVGKFLTEKNPDVKIIAVEPTESRVLTGAKHTAHTILGIGAGVPVPFIEKIAPGQEFAEGPRGYVSEFASATSDEAVEWAKKMTTMEGMMIGPSAGAAISVAMSVAARPEAAGKTIVVLCASHGIRYTAHPLWKAVKEEAVTALPSPPVLDPEAPLLLFDSSKL